MWVPPKKSLRWDLGDMPPRNRSKEDREEKIQTKIITKVTSMQHARNFTEFLGDLSTKIVCCGIGLTFLLLFECWSWGFNCCCMYFIKAWRQRERALLWGRKQNSSQSVTATGEARCELWRPRASAPPRPRERSKAEKSWHLYISVILKPWYVEG